MRVLLLSLAVAATVAAGPDVEVIETGPLGSELDLSEFRNAIDVYPELFAQAESTIDIAQMYMLYYRPESKGRLLYRLYDGLIAAAERGVRVRVLLDSTTLESNPIRTYSRVRSMLADVEGIDVRACDLRPWSDYSDCMMHAKYCVIDRGTALVGSHNWSYGGFADNRELSLLVREPTFARQVGSVFEQDWSLGSGEAAGLAVSGGGEVGLALTMPRGLRDSAVSSTLASLVSLVDGARRSLDVEVNSFSTRVDVGEAERFDAVEQALARAGRRGVKVRLLVDHWAHDHEPRLFRGLDSIPGVTVKVANIARSGPNPDAGTVHAKLVVADAARSLVGTATFSQRQLVECRNVGAVVEDEGLAAELGRLFQADWSSGYNYHP